MPVYSAPSSLDIHKPLALEYVSPLRIDPLVEAAEFNEVSELIEGGILSTSLVLTEI